LTFVNDCEFSFVDLNAFAKEVGNSNFSDDDLSKIAFWMATGSGKTLIMHINLWQILQYAQSDFGKGKARFDNVLLITPNEGLSRQHIDEFYKSGITAWHYHEATNRQLFLNANQEPCVIVIEITKLTKNKRGKGLSVDVDAFGSSNLLLVDEGHRGASGEVWREVRRKLAEHGYL
jgi:type I site-specific restriction-modification system R (restriction) subunit